VPREEVTQTARALDAIVPEASYLGGCSRHVVEIAGPLTQRHGMAEIARHSVLPAIGRLAARALDARRVQLLQDSVLIKPPGGGPVEWHQDYSYLGYLDRPAVVTVRLSLTSCTIDSGCLRVIDGSHGWGLSGADLSFRRSSIEDTLVMLPPERRASARDAEVALELGPGDVSLHHCLTFHGSAVNRSTWPRKTLVMRFMDAECRLVRERLPDAALASRFPIDDKGCLSTTAFPVVHDERS
jgi:ectoine hydroxylase-related dioxygenase (phytanoyl-CoA dioxygenase family)